MPRHLLLAVLAFAAVGAATAGVLNAAGTVQNKFTVTFNLIPDPFHLFSFFSMPRNLDEAFQDSWKLHYTMDNDDIEVHCRKNDYRVCVLFDRRGNVAGIRLSISAEELDNADLPIDIENTPEWRRWTFFEFGDVYSATVYFQSKEQIGAGGRHLTGNDLVIPEGLWILQTNQTGETGRLHVPLEESGAEAAGFREQDCFLGMGKHYFQELTPESTCEAHRPYFMLYGPQTKKLNGFGFTMYGKPSTDRGWFEHPPAIVAKAIAPNSPACMTDFINKYGMFTMHVYFIDNPKGIRC
ncbi:hypothetical protein ONE63_006529 [Megalurothrips usitatus]|uniref:Carbohydrate-binding domain-containing protein n=1 Tax=Megalurothrips usitatus TaxID=439358 RepID=A0AAV7XXT9_9NEOP|nr:hypothetical protein ONE63_006529 [Megalurothrips usitatus]